MADNEILLGTRTFRKMREDKSYIDKTGFIKEFLSGPRAEVSLITRPRRFGKSLLLNMLMEFFDQTKDSRKLFDGLAVSKDNDICAQWMNKYPVIYLSLNEIKEESFDDLYYKVYYAICACIEIPECMSYKIRFKFYSTDETIHELSLSKFLLNINAWRPLIELNNIQQYYRNKIEVLDESFIVGIMMSDSLRVGLESKVMQTLTEYGIEFEKIAELLKVVIERYQEASIEFSLTSKSSIMTYESIFLNDYRKSEKLKELNNMEIPQSLQTADVEELLRNKTAELVAELGKTKNPIWYVSKAGKHIKEKQVQELYLSYGQIPDVSGNVIPYTMEGNGFSTGILIQ